MPRHYSMVFSLFYLQQPNAKINFAALDLQFVYRAQYYALIKKVSHKQHNAY